MKHALERIGEFDGNPNKVYMLTALEWCEAAWNKVSATTIRNCWLHSTLISKGSVSFVLN
ncbi:hypothetical protein JG688_00012698 [Phytophthora aleatoria]|uniref:DDE-1 domain-containing protein n=1 Tax=Phytophthora aleatoria TaxID=2496075 RepID=A0A8J5ME97_9STRA|nr:hypothetical protein JG688_00012698 [Phytophthora aleatoria]